ncbi:MAG TPA: 2-oxo-4-hydroxy-4-carboxy-5-ureidoimidazoline decarboxylase [Longimicrobium sp.]|nr:2-oxo-4-hydroxy-4-carboxy-5-ureidoimidazoline decarboxylase [Longimicrobium sp.]
MSGLERLNDLPDEEAEAAFLTCCGATIWARQMTRLRPFITEGELLEAADRVWWSLNPEDWLESFRAHPRIGERKAETPQNERAATWSAQEQAGAASAGADVAAQLAEGNRVYEQRFGYIYIVKATGKTADEMLAILRERLANDPETELRIAAGEQAKITRLRLEKLLAEGPSDAPNR